METLISLLIFLVIVGIFFLPAIPIPEPFKMAIVAVLALIVILYQVIAYLPHPLLR